jgi:hypothetical protein
MASFDHWLPYHPASRVALTYVTSTNDGAVTPASVYLTQAEMTGTARPEERRTFAQGEGIWWIRGHHDETSVEGQALLAAYALDRCAA